MLTVLWDNDGVLVDTEGMYFQACKEVLGTVGVDLTPAQFKDISLRQGVSTFVLAAEQGVTAEDVARLRKQRDRIYQQLLAAQSCVNDGAEAVVRALHGRVAMGVVTGSLRQHFEAAHAKSGLMKFMDFVLTREDYAKSKPDPEPYLTAMKRHHLRPDQCLVVEDSERGLASATAAGIDCIILLSDWTSGGNFDRAVAVVDNLFGVLAEVRKRVDAASANRSAKEL